MIKITQLCGRFGLAFSCLGKELGEVGDRLRHFDDGFCPECGAELEDEYKWSRSEEGNIFDGYYKEVTGEFCGCGYRRSFEDE